MKAYLTKYALTDGIRELEVSEGPGHMICWKFKGYQQYAHKGDWFKTAQEAIDDANLRRVKRLASLRLQVAKLEKMTFAAAPALERTETL